MVAVEKAKSHADFCIYSPDLSGDPDGCPVAFGTYRNLDELCGDRCTGRIMSLVILKKYLSDQRGLRVALLVHCCTDITFKFSDKVVFAYARSMAWKKH